MQWENILISKILETGDIQSVIVEQKISSDHFKTGMAREVYDYLLSKTPNVPSLEYIKEKYPDFEYQPLRDSLEDICQKVRDNAISVDILSSINETELMLEKDPRKAAFYLEQNSAKILSKYSTPGRDLIFEKNKDLILEEYTKTQEGKLMGVSWPWPSMNEETRGLHGGDLILIYAAPKQTKSWLLCCLAMHFYSKEKLKVLLVSKEMAPRILQRRCAAILGRVNYQQFRKGQLSTRDFKKMEGALHSLNGSGNLTISDARAEKGDVSVGSIQAKQEELKSDIILVDGIYLLADQRTKTRTIDWKSMSHISTDLKDLALKLNIPIVASAQANRYGSPQSENFEDMAHTQGFAMDGDVILRLMNNKKEKKLAILVKGAREFDLEGLTINADFARDFSEICRGIDKELFKKKGSFKAHYNNEEEKNEPFKFENLKV